MKPAPVHILATVRKPELIDAALLVFRTLRTGFPQNPVCVWGNALDAWSEALVAQACSATRVQSFTNLAPTVHDAWIEELLEESIEPFWICDTDVCFWDHLAVGPTWEAMAGRFEPGFEEESTGTLHVERLHTAVMWFDPAAVRAAMRGFMAQIPPPWGHKGNFPFVRQQFIPVRGGKTLFYDSCAGLWQAGIGRAFTEEEDKRFDHIHCGTYIDMIAPLLSTNLAETHQAIYQDFRRARGMREHQAKYYQKLRPPKKG